MWFDEKWQEVYELAKSYYEHYNNLQIPRNFKTKNGYEFDENGVWLGAWLNYQKLKFRSNELDEEKVKLLQKLGIDFVIKNPEEEWKKQFLLAQKYYEHHGNLYIPRNFKTNNGYEFDNEGIKLGDWIITQRRTYKSGKISTERIEKLNSIHMIWSLRSMSKKIVSLCLKLNINVELNIDVLENLSFREFYIKVSFLLENNMDITKEGILHEIFSMSSTNLKAKYGVSVEELFILHSEKNKTKPKKGKKEGVDLGTNEKWQEAYELAKKYYEHYGDLKIEKTFTTQDGIHYDENGFKLGVWITYQRERYSKDMLSVYRINKLNEIGMIFNKREENFYENYALAQKYYEHHGNLEMIKRFKTINGYEYNEYGVALGDWIKNLRDLYHQNKLSQDKIDMLMCLDMRFEGTKKDYYWNQTYELAKKYYEHYGNLKIAKTFKTQDGIYYDENGIWLGAWLKTQKIKFKNNELDEEKIKLLQALGINFEIKNLDEEWNKQFLLAQKYYEHHGNVKVPRHFKTKNGYEYDEEGANLGNWIVNQRSAYKNGKICTERVEKLNSIHMIWSIKKLSTKIVDLCLELNIDVELNKEVLTNISFKEFYAKV